MPSISAKVIGRLSLYRRFLVEVRREGSTHVFSHDLARLAGVTAAQVRRDLMGVGYSGSSVRGYEVEALIGSIGKVLDSEAPEGIALVGLGNLGRAILDYVGGRRSGQQIVAAFDVDRAKVNRVIHSCRCYGMEDLAEVVEEQGIGTALITVPANAAQEVAERLVGAGVRGILNFAPVRLRVPEGVFVEDVDVAMVLEKVAYFARQVGATE
jgi:redox-sensing transcriptional repressor